MIALKEFAVFQSLRVHNLEVKPKSVSATYEIIHKDGTVVNNTFFYTYNDSIFSKKNEEDLNLASMMLSQVAINHGLFCEELIF